MVRDKHCPPEEEAEVVRATLRSVQTHSGLSDVLANDHVHLLLALQLRTDIRTEHSGISHSGLSDVLANDHIDTSSSLRFY